MRNFCLVVVLFALAGVMWPVRVQAASLVSEVSIWGEATDLTPGVVGSVSNLNRLGGLGSSISYDPVSQTLWAIPDRGPGDGSLSFESRLQKFHLAVDPVTGALGNLQLQETIRFKTTDGSQVFNGRLPMLPGDDPHVLGLAIDPEGLVVTPAGKVYVAEEYGPAIREFELVTANGITEARQTAKQFAIPSRYIPMDNTSQPNYVSATPVSGRQSGRGFESLTMTPDGTKLYTAMQSPLTQEGGRNSRNIRLAQFDVASGQRTGEFIYQLETVADVNARIPDEFNAEFKSNQQGRNITPNELFALNDHELLVVERDNRGIGTGNATNADPVLSHVGTKRVYRIDLSGATDVSTIDLLSTGALPPGVVPVDKDPNPVLDIQQVLSDAGLPIPEKFEGISLVPLTGSRPYALLMAVDNDFSVVDVADPVTGEVQFFDVYTDGTLRPIDTAMPGGSHLLPCRIYSFVVPEPGSIGLMLSGLAGGAAFMLRGSVRRLGRRPTRA
jgi:hypothetical protein